jgi:hypothetical protein
MDDTPMSALQALDAARAAGLEVRLDGKDLVLSAPCEPPADVVDMLRRHKFSIVTLLGPTQPWDPADWQAYFDERVGIAEFDGGLSRTEAEARAFHCCVSEWLLRNPIESSPDWCLECGKSGETGNPLLAIGVVGAGQAWLHCCCVAAWHSARTETAVASLNAMNIVGAQATQPNN